MSNYINKINIKGTEYDIQGNITIGSSEYTLDVVTDTIYLGSGLRHDKGGGIYIDRKALIGTDSLAIITIPESMIENANNYNIKLKATTSEVITKDLYYNDGSNKHVPVRHPDLSTQPSILPYKFMGLYVYEQLIYLGEFKDGSVTKVIDLRDIAPEAVIISCEGFVYGNTFLYDGNNYNPMGVMGLPMSITVRGTCVKPSDTYQSFPAIEIKGITSIENLDALGSYTKDCKAYARIVYTFMPEEGGGDSYGYNNY